jgi:hypothetical protein
MSSSRDGWGSGRWIRKYRAHVHAILATVKRLVAFYVTEHNERIPHGAFEGQTPDEMYFGRGAPVPDELAARRREARRLRLEENQAAVCAACPRGARAPASSEHIAA